MQPNNHNSFSIAEISEFQNGYAFKSENLLSLELPNSKPVLKMGHIEPGGGLRVSPKQDYHLFDSSLSRYLLKAGDIVIAMTDMKDNMVILGHPAFITTEDKFLLNQRVGRIRVNNDKIYSKFLYYYLRNQETIDELQKTANSGVQVNLTTEGIKSFRISAPPLPEQIAIAEVLSSLDDKIDLLHRNNKTLEELAETLFREWFVERANTDWEDKPLDEIANYLNGLALQKYPVKNGEAILPVIKIREMNQGITESTDLCSADIPLEYIINSGDVLFSWSGSLEIKIWSGPKGALNQHLFKVTSENYPKWFIYFATKYHLPLFRDIANDKATTMGHIQRKHLSQATIKVCDAILFRDYDSIITPLFNKFVTNLTGIKTLEEMRDTLLPKLLNGTVKIQIY